MRLPLPVRSLHVNFRKDEAGYYVAHCLELPAAMTQGKTEEEAVRNIREAIHLVLEATREEGIKKPAVTAIELVA